MHVLLLLFSEWLQPAADLLSDTGKHSLIASQSAKTAPAQPPSPLSPPHPFSCMTTANAATSSATFSTTTTLTATPLLQLLIQLCPSVDDSVRQLSMFINSRHLAIMYQEGFA